MKYKSEMVKVNYLDGIRVWVDVDTRYLTTNEDGTVCAHYSSYPRVCEIAEDEWISSVTSNHPVLQVDLDNTDWRLTLVDVRDQIKAIINAKNEDVGCWQTFDPSC